MTDKFVCVINRNRDGYQVPLALHEAGLLASFVTDFYARERPTLWLPALLRRRRVRGLPKRFTRSAPVVFVAQYAAQILRLPMGRVFRVTARMLAKRAKAEARVQGAGLYCYHEYIPRNPPRDRPLILFVYHPLPQHNYALLRDDAALYPEVAESFAREQAALQHFKLPVPWSRPDAVVCASSFTAQTVIADGCPPDKIAVIPYGLPERTEPMEFTPPGQNCRFLYVGQGVQRKGIHHLIRAWQSAPRDGAMLTIVSYQIDDAIADLASDPSIRILGYQSRAELDRLRAESDVFVMPSLIEGFGLVYLEALQHGLHVIGTPNTGLPDLALDDQAVTLVSPGDIDALSAAIDDTIARWRAGEFDKAQIAGQGARWTQGHFRRSIAEHAAAVLKAFAPAS